MNRVRETPAGPKYTAVPGGTEAIPLCIDLDGTLVQTDTLWESVLQLWRQPLLALRAVGALMVGGKAAFKATIASEIGVDAKTLPYRDEVLEFAKREQAAGRKIVLATAAHRLIAERVDAHLGIFSEIVATDGTTNL